MFSALEQKLQCTCTENRPVTQWDKLFKPYNTSPFCLTGLGIKTLILPTFPLVIINLQYLKVTVF